MTIDNGGTFDACHDFGGDGDYLDLRGLGGRRPRTQDLRLGAGDVRGGRELGAGGGGRGPRDSRSDCALPSTDRHVESEQHERDQPAGQLQAPIVP